MYKLVRITTNNPKYHPHPPSIPILPPISPTHISNVVVVVFFFLPAHPFFISFLPFFHHPHSSPQPPSVPPRHPPTYTHFSRSPPPPILRLLQHLQTKQKKEPFSSHLLTPQFLSPHFLSNYLFLSPLQNPSNPSLLFLHLHLLT